MNPKIIKEAVEGVLNGAAGILDAIPNAESKAKVKNELAKLTTDAMNSVVNTQAEVLKSEMAGNWLQRSWRPITMLCFVFIIVSIYFIMPLIDIWVDNDELTDFYKSFKDHLGFWDLVYVGMGGYVASRGVEKVVDSFTKNVDLPFLSRKQRKDLLKVRKND